MRAAGLCSIESNFMNVAPLTTDRLSRLNQDYNGFKHRPCRNWHFFGGRLRFAHVDVGGVIWEFAFSHYTIAAPKIFVVRQKTLVRVIGLEPILLWNGLLRPARLPVPPHPHKAICSGEKRFCNRYCSSGATLSGFLLTGLGLRTLMAAASRVFFMCDA